MPQMFFKRFLLSSVPFLLFFILTFTASTEKVIAQNTSSTGENSEEATSSFSGFSKLNLPNDLSHFFYVDELGLQLSSQVFPLEFPINRSTYRLGPNDIVTLDAEGSTSMLMRGMTINSGGDLIIPTVGNINIAGLTIDSAESKLKNSFGQTYDSVNINLTLDKPRMQQVHVTGDISNPGKYTFPAQTRVSEVVKWILEQQRFSEQKSKKEQNSPADRQGTEGPTSLMTSSLDEQLSNEATSTNREENEGKQLTEEENYLNTFNRNYLTKDPYSLRNIVIDHRNGDVDTVDLVSYFATGKLTSNPFILDGDVIKLHKLSRWTSRLSISGAVTTPFETEYNKSDTLSELIKMAGGFAPDADTTQVNVYRKFDQNINKVVVQHDNFDQFKLKPNDRIIVPIDQSAQTTQAAWIYGQISNPGQYPIIEGQTTARKLLKLAGGLTEEALPRGAYLTRSGSTQFPESKIKDRIIELDRSELKRTSTQTLEGLEYLNLETRVSEGKVPIDLSDAEQLSQLKLYDGDKLYIPRDRNTVFVFGQVNRPGHYTYNNEFSADNYINKAGGFTLPAEKNEVFVIKAGSRTWYDPDDTQIRSGDMIFVNRSPFQQYAQSKNLRNESIRLILTGLSTITSVITTYLVIIR